MYAISSKINGTVRSAIRFAPRQSGSIFMFFIIFLRKNFICIFDYSRTQAAFPYDFGGITSIIFLSEQFTKMRFFIKMRVVFNKIGKIRFIYANRVFL